MRAPVVLLLVVLAAAGSVAGCGSSLRDETSGGGSTKAGSTDNGITMAGVFCVCFANAYVAWKKGFFAEEGVPIKRFVTTKAGSDTFQALAGGDVDFALNGLDAIMRGQAKGVKVRSVAVVSPEFYALTVRKQMTGEIKGAQNLKGKKVAVSKIGSASWAFLQLITRRAGLKEGDVKIVQLGGIDTIMASLKRGTVDAAVTWEPGTSQGKAQGFGVTVLNALLPADHQRIYGSPASISMTLATTDQLLKSNPDTVRKTVRALNKADAWMAAHSPAEVADVIAPVAPGLDRGLLVAAVKDTLVNFPKTASISRAAYESSANVLKDSGIVEKVPPLEQPFICDFATCTA
jgi:NitT/TauT family transport system substrate-binding protein